jgi:hypothetical protein
VLVSIVTNGENGTPLNYRYTVTGGRIIGQGPNVLWDFNADNAPPGDYSITVLVDDGMGTYSRALTKSISLEEADCDCPCVCPTVGIRSHKSQVQRGGKLDFEARVGGGDANQIEYRWKVTNGRITSGQGTPSIKVTASPDKTSRLVTANLEVGLDVDCDCPKEASESVPIGPKSITRTFPLDVTWLSLAESTIVLACRDCSPDPNEPTSKDAILEVETHTASNYLTDKLVYSYEVSGGNIIDTGQSVRWDLTGLDPGTYTIKVNVSNRHGETARDTRTVTVASEGIRDPMPCPTLSLSTPERIGTTSDFIVRAEVTGRERDTEDYVWKVDGGELIAGQGSNFVRIRATSINASDPGPVVSITLRLPPGFACSPSASVHLWIPEPK